MPRLSQLEVHYSDIRWAKQLLQLLCAVCLVRQSCPPLCDPGTVAHQAPLSLGILQATILEWVATPFSRGSPQPRDQTQVSRIAGGFFTVWATMKPKNTEVGAVLCLVTQLCPTICDTMDCGPQGFPAYGDSPGKNNGVGSLSLLQGIFPTQGSNPGLQHYRRILHHLSHQTYWPRNQTGVSCIAGRFLKIKNIFIFTKNFTEHIHHFVPLTSAFF